MNIYEIFFKKSAYNIDTFETGHQVVFILLMLKLAIM